MLVRSPVPYSFIVFSIVAETAEPCDDLLGVKLTYVGTYGSGFPARCTLPSRRHRHNSLASVSALRGGMRKRSVRLDHSCPEVRGLLTHSLS